MPRPKPDLGEVLARMVYDTATKSSADGIAFEETTDEIREGCRDWGERQRPLFVEFVAEWIVARPGLLPVQPEDLAATWRKEMSDA